VVADTTTELGSMLLAPLGNEDQIVLNLSHDHTNVGLIHASFDLLDHGALSRHFDLAATAQIFGTDTPGYAGDDENWTRVQVIAVAPDQNGSSVQGTYGSFNID